MSVSGRSGPPSARVGRGGAGGGGAPWPRAVSPVRVPGACGLDRGQDSVCLVSGTAPLAPARGLPALCRAPDGLGRLALCWAPGPQ